MKVSKFIILITFSLALISCKDKLSEKEKTKHQNALDIHNNLVLPARKSQSEAIKSFVKNMTKEQKTSQLFVVNLVGNQDFTPVEYDKDNNPWIAGGYLFFAYNLSSTIEGTRAFTNNITAYCEKEGFVPPYYTIDQEGGWVQRLKTLSPKLPSAENVARDNNLEEALAVYTEQAEYMKEMGFHMNLAPVVEICTPSNSEFLMERSFGDAEQTENYSRTAVFAYENNGISTVIKHFPGNTNTDPHSGLPEITLSNQEMEASLTPFYSVLQWEPDAVLMSHARTTIRDADLPACLSKKWVTDVLKNQHKYQGLIFSDDIYMGALAQNGYPPEKAVIMALDAGVDIIMISEKRFSKLAQIVISECEKNPEFEDIINEKVEKILAWKLKKGIWHY